MSEIIEGAKETLNPKLWQGEELIPEVKDKLLEIANNFIAYLKEDEIDLKLKDVLIIGSNANYNYTDESDIDLHIIVDMSEVDDEVEKRLLTILYNAYRVLFNSKYDVKIKGHDAELYVEPDETNTKSEGVFSLLNGWIKKPFKETFKDDESGDKEFEAEFKKWEDRYKELISDVNVGLEEEVDSEETITTYTGSHSSDEHYEHMGLLAHKNIGIHCGTKEEIKENNYTYTYELKLDNYSLLELDFDLSPSWAIPELAHKISDDKDEVRMLLTKIKVISGRKDKLERASTIYRDFWLSKGYDLVSYPSDSNRTSYIILDTSIISSAKLIEEENLSDVETSKLDEIDEFIKDIYELRKSALTQGGENSVGNKVFKQFRRLGYLQDLKKIKTAFETKQMSLESLYETVEEISDEELFWHLRDGLESETETKYTEQARKILTTLEGNLFLNKGKIDILPNPDGMFAVSPEQYPYFKLEKDGLLRFKDAVDGEFVMFYNSTDKYGREYSVLTSNEELCIKACKGELGDEFAKQKSYAKYTNGKYEEVVVNPDLHQLPNE